MTMKRGRLRRAAGVIALGIGLLVGAASCTPRMFHQALMTAAIIGTVAVLTHHDAHFHDAYCGHPREWHDGRWVYHYQGRWEYYDHRSGNWYYFE